MSKALIACLDAPYPAELRELAEQGLDDYARSLPETADVPAELVPVCWVEGVGWLEGPDALLARRSK